MKLFIQENLWVAGWLGGAVKSHLVRSTIQGFASSSSKPKIHLHSITHRTSGRCKIKVMVDSVSMNTVGHLADQATVLNF